MNGELLPNFIEQMPGGIALCQMLYQHGKPYDFLYLYTNPAFYEQTGLGKVTGLRISEIFPDFQASEPNILEIYGRVAAGGAAESFEIFWQPLQKWFNIQAFSTRPEHFFLVVNVNPQRNQAEQAIHQCENLYRDLLNDQTELICRFQVDGRIQYANQAFCKLFGKSAESLAGQTWHPLVYPEDLTLVKSKLSALSPENPLVTIENRLVLPDGSVRWGQFINRGYFNTSGSLTELLSVGRDITEQKRIEALNQQLDSRLAQIATRVPGMIYEYQLRADGSSCFPYASDGIRNIYRVEPEAVKADASAVLAILHPDDYASVVASIQESAATLTPWQLEYRVRFADGTIRWLYGNSIPHKADDDSVIWHGFITDITEKKAIAEKLQTLLVATEQSPISMIIYDVDGNIEYVNDHFIKVSGYSREELIGQNRSFLKSDLSPAATHFDMWNSVTQGLSWHGELLSQKRNLEYFWEELHIAPVYDEQGSISHFVGVMLDITDRKLAGMALRDSENKFAKVFNNSPIGIGIESLKNGKYLDVNDAFLKATEFSRKEISTYTAAELGLWESSAQREQMLGLLKNGEVVSNFEITCNAKTGLASKTFLVSIDTIEIDGTDCMLEMFIDISARKRIEQALKNQTEKTQAILRNASDGIHILDYDGYVMEASDSFCDMLGYSRNEILGMHVSQWDTGDCKTEIMHSVRRQFEKPVRTEFERRHRRKDGSVFAVEISGFPLELEGKPVIFNSSRDISERKRMAAEMQFWANAFSNCAHGIAIGDQQTNCILFCNQAFADMLGYSSPVELSGVSVFSLYTPESYEHLKTWIQQAAESGKLRFEAQFRHKNGNNFDVQVDLVCVYDDQHNVLYRVATVQDISQRKFAEAQLHIRSRALEAAANGIVISDAQGIIEWVNPAFTMMTGYSASEAIGQTPQSLFKSAELEQAFYDNQWETICSGKVWHGEILNRRKDGTRYTEEKLITPVYDEQGIIRHFIAIKQDVTIRKHNEAELEQLVEARTSELHAAREEAERLSQIKGMFLANMSHEIRTPLNAVMGFCYLLEQHQLSEESRQLVSKINRAGHSLLSIINDILDFSKIEAGKLEIETEHFVLGEIIDDLTALMSTTADTKLLELRVAVPTGIHALIGDGLRIQQVLVNLLSNAIKFTESGYVELRIEIEAQHGARVNLRFSVCDTGTGISDEKQAEIFSAFTQADTSISRRFGGTGLGLAISQQLVQLMGGTLHVNSSIGHGSEFWFILPLEIDYATVNQPTKPPRLANSDTPRLAGLKILVVDDSEINLEVAKCSLEVEGAVVNLAKDGQEAVEYLASHPDNVDLIIMDIQMPRMDGYTATRVIREQPRWQKLPIIALSAGAFSTQQSDAQAAGMDGFVAKPFKIDELVNLILDLIPDFTAVLKNSQSTTSAVTGNKVGDVTGELPGIDIAGGLQRWGNAKVYHTYLQKFVDAYKTAGNSIENLLANNENQPAKDLAHKLKGAAGNLSLNSVMNHAGSLEAAIAQNEAASTAIARQLQQFLDQACHSISILTNPQPADRQQADRNQLNNAELLLALNKLLDVLRQEHLRKAESMLETLPNNIAGTDISKVRTSLADFDIASARNEIEQLLAKMAKA